MTLQKLTKKINREFRRSPKKSAILGLMCFVAGYLWIPIAWSWVFPTAEGEGDGELYIETFAEDSESKSKKKKSIPWYEVAAAIQNDPWMKPADLSSPRRDPFQNDEESVRRYEVLMGRRKRSTRYQTPQQLNLKLTSTSIGSRVRQATISGFVYKVGKEIVVTPKDGRSEDTRFKVKQIDRGRVVLEREGEDFVLKLEELKLGAGDRLVVGP